MPQKPSYGYLCKLLILRARYVLGPVAQKHQFVRSEGRRLCSVIMPTLSEGLRNFGQGDDNFSITTKGL